VQIEPEARRKGFAALDKAGYVGQFYTTSERSLLQQDLGADNAKIALSPQAGRLLVQADNQLALHHLHNPHPELSWQALWHKVWYEHYTEPQYIWQLSASTVDFEAKLSLAPPTFGTFKVASLPRRLPHCRRHLQRLLYGFRLAAQGQTGDWADGSAAHGYFGIFCRADTDALCGNAPAGVFSLLLILPLGVLAFALLYRRLPQRRLNGYESLLLIALLLIWRGASHAAQSTSESLVV